MTYHSLDESGSVISVPPQLFRRQMEALAAGRTRVVPLAQIVESPGAVAITFDDGFANFAEHAVPVLQDLSLPATVFVVSGYSGRSNDWPSQSSEVPRLPLMSWSTLRDLPPPISIGAHTINHPDLRTSSKQEIASEIEGSRSEIEQRTGRPVNAFAYPYGGVNAHAAAVVRERVGLGCGTQLRFVDPGSDRAVLPRLDVYYLKSKLWFDNPLNALNRIYIGLRGSLREVRQWSLR
jgi:peptidoglycan/xylan/chitin deacetylase (PgdA/CDA1 family)